MPRLSEKFDTLSEEGIIIKEVPDFVVKNLNPELDLREYQIEAISRFIHYIGGYQNRQKPSQLLFEMATGSGKTLVMAAAMLYLYEQGYRNFVFFVNSTTIIEKTKENFLNPLSSKYLFNEKISFGEKQVRVKEVDNFEAANQEDINILFTTIQGLHTRLNQPKENSVTYEDFEDRGIVLISDEAHHLNTLTKRQTELSKEEEEEATSWEHTVKKILAAHVENMLLEFTATAGLEHPAIADKYSDKILFQYDLKQFREDGFSKDVDILQADLKPLDRALMAVILSQYRRKVAEKHGIRLKPVLLMKSKTIEESKQIEEAFHEKIKKLQPRDIHAIEQREQETVIKKAFAFFKKNKITHEHLLQELKEDFSEEKCMAVNSKDDSQEKQIIVNTLEAPNNEVRIIFAVDKLNEGWDVLNLFDIVRLYETRDSKSNIPGKTTIAEAQLIGRGARYYPFQLDESQERYKRKYDEELDNELRILEELHYHSSHNPRYIQELNRALVETGIKPEKEREIPLRVKEKFKESRFWKEGIIWLNRKEANDQSDVFSLADADMPQTFTYHLHEGSGYETRIFERGEEQNREYTTETIKLTDLGVHVVRTATAHLPFYTFSNLTSERYFPNVGSMREFIESDKYLGGATVEVRGQKDALYRLVSGRLNQDEKLAITVSVLHDLATKLETEVAEYRGTKVFYPTAVQYVIKDKTIKISVNAGGDQERGIGMRETSNKELWMDIREKEWCVYDENYGTSEEKYLIKFINDAVEELKKKYDDVYLIRNERLFKIFRFSDGASIEPDFVLFLREPKSRKAVLYQLFIEPKGEHLVAGEQWKEDFLREIKKEYELETVFKNKEFKLVGLPFYNEGGKKREFEEEFRKVLALK